MAGWLPRASWWVPWRSQGESWQQESQHKLWVGRKEARHEQPAWTDPRLAACFLGKLRAVRLQGTGKVTRTIVLVQKLFFIPHLHYISFTHDTSFSNNRSCVICLLFVFHLLLSNELILSLMTHYKPKILLLSDNGQFRNNYFVWKV